MSCFPLSLALDGIVETFAKTHPAARRSLRALSRAGQYSAGHCGDAVDLADRLVECRAITEHHRTRHVVAPVGTPLLSLG